MADKTKLLVGKVTVKLGTAGSAYSEHTEVGYTTEDGATANINTTKQPTLTNEVLEPVKHRITAREASVSFTFREISLANMAKAIPGASVAGDTLTLSNTLTEYALSLHGYMDQGQTQPLIYYWGYVTPGGSFAQTLQLREDMTIPAQYDAQGDMTDSNVFKIIVV